MKLWIMAAIPYIDVTPSIFACDEEGPYYNQVIDTAAVHHYGCKGPKPYTGGCIAFGEDKMTEILRRCDLSLVVTVRE